MDFIQEMGIKDLEHVVLKAKDHITIGTRTFEPGEPVLYFNNIQIALLSENTQVVAARGGFLNQPRVVWEDRSDTTFQFSNGTLNLLSLNMLLEANTLQENNILAPMQELIEVEDGRAYLRQSPDLSKKRFYKIFEAENIQHRAEGNQHNLKTKLSPIKEDIENKIVYFNKEFNGTIMADYYFKPENAPISYTLNRERKANLYTLEATFYLKDENDGLLHTGILEMPKVYIMSNINLRMGERADPTVGTFRIVAMPEDYDGYDSMVCRVTYLDNDIYGI